MFGWGNLKKLGHEVNIAGTYLSIYEWKFICLLN